MSAKVISVSRPSRRVWIQPNGSFSIHAAIEVSRAKSRNMPHGAAQVQHARVSRGPQTQALQRNAAGTNS